MGLKDKFEELKEKADLNRLSNMRDKINLDGIKEKINMDKLTELKDKILDNQPDDELEEMELLPEASGEEKIEVPSERKASDKMAGVKEFINDNKYRLADIRSKMQLGIVADFKDKVKELFSKEEAQGSIFVMRLLFEDKCSMPKIKDMETIMKKHISSAEFIVNDGRVAAFDVMEFAKYKDPEDKTDYIAPQLLIANCKPADRWGIDDVTRSQLWNCKGGEVYIDYCKYMVVASDLLADTIEYKDRANMLMDYMEALMEMFPSCKAVFIDNSCTIFTREQILGHEIERDERFLYFAVNKRFFTVEGTEEMIVDTLGMSTLRLPDLQYHFHDADPNDVADHALDVMWHLYCNGCSIESGDKIDGMMDGDLWKCQYEESLIAPSRPVMDIDMGKFAAGIRTEE